eukprot:13068624-Alexandrium_andersonii.AAC.1
MLEEAGGEVADGALLLLGRGLLDDVNDAVLQNVRGRRLALGRPEVRHPGDLAAVQGHVVGEVALRRLQGVDGLEDGAGREALARLEVGPRVGAVAVRE